MAKGSILGCHQSSSRKFSGHLCHCSTNEGALTYLHFDVVIAVIVVVVVLVNRSILEFERLHCDYEMYL